jgi:hypothetical protein
MTLGRLARVWPADSLPYRIIDRAERLVERRRLGPVAKGTSFVRLRGRLFVVHEQPGVDERRAKRENLDAVLSAAEVCELPWFVMDSADGARTRVGVETSTLAPLVAELRRLHPTLYVNFRDSQGKAHECLMFDVDPEKVRDVDTMSFFAIVRPHPGLRPLGSRQWCRVDRWGRDEEGDLSSPVANLTSSIIPAGMATPRRIVVAERKVTTLEAFRTVRMDQVTFPIDVVYMWVDDQDPAWRERRDACLLEAGQLPALSAAPSRFRQHGELRYSFRSLERFAPWVRRVHLVTDQQRPAWLVDDHPRMRVVDHRDIFEDPSGLPTFNSHAISTKLHRIPDLADRYLVLNDDVLFGRPVSPGLFFDANGVAKYFLSRATLPIGRVSADDLPHEAARKRARDLVTAAYGHTPIQAFKHTPIPQVRELHELLEQRYADVYRRTSAHRFRSSEDVEVVSWLHNYAGFFERFTRPGDIRYDYFNIGERAALERMEYRLVGQGVDCLCVNDADDGDAPAEERATRLHRFFETLLPEPSSFERP